MMSSSRVYPRVYGGTRHTFLGGGIGGGLSPRVRGNQTVEVGRRVGRGSIPACTGEPEANAVGDRNDQVYPRVYGGTR